MYWYELFKSEIYELWVFLGKLVIGLVVKVFKGKYDVISLVFKNLIYLFRKEDV